MKSIRLLSVLAVLLAAGHSDRACAQSLAETVRLSLENSKSLKAEDGAARKARLEATAAFRSTLPRLDVEASYRHVTDVAGVAFPAAVPGLPAGGFDLGVYDTYEAGLTASYLLFSGFAQRNRTLMMRQRADLAEIRRADTKRHVAFQTVALYREAQSFMLEIEVLDASLERVAWQERRVGSLVEQGMALALDTLSLSLTRLDYRQKRIAASGDLRTTRQRLHQMAGRDIDVEAFRPAGHRAAPFSLSLERVEAYRLLRQQETLAATGIELKKADYYPAVALYAGYRYGRPGVDVINDEWMQYGVWGVSLNWSLFGWGSDRLETAASREDLRRATWQREALADELRTEYDNALRELQSIEEQIAAAGQYLKVARDKLSVIESRYNQGMVSTSDYNEADLELTEAELNHRRQVLRLELKINEIEFLSGASIEQWSLK
ncbi:MAG TPA: TolC family protein [Patescibacteria group bacterium]|nr:TolC family protein [Patescibacteria group bacterium]